MLIWLQLLACTSGGVTDGPELPLLDLGADRVDVADVDLDVTDPEATWLAAEHTLPGLSWTFPARSIASGMWNAALEESVADSGSCPFIESLGGGDLTYRSDCTSGEGYDWEGTVSELGWEDEDGVQWEQITYDLLITHDEEDASFSLLQLDGDVITARRDGEGISTHFQVNLEARYVGWYAERADLLHEDTHSDYAVTGWAEIEPGDTNTWTMDLAARIGSYGTFSISSDALVQDQEGCEEEPDGQVTLLGTEETVLTLQGSRTCDRCVQWEDSTGEQKACEP